MKTYLSNAISILLKPYRPKLSELEESDNSQLMEVVGKKFEKERKVKVKP